jgi:hypothetical protein
LRKPHDRHVTNVAICLTTVANLEKAAREPPLMHMPVKKAMK